MNDSLLFLVPALFVGGIFSAVAGGGLGIIMILLLNLIFPIQVSVALGGILGFAIQGAKTFHFRHSIRWDLVWWYALPGLPAAYVAGLIMFALPARAIEIGIGLFCVWMGCKELFPGFLGRPLRLHPHRWALVIGGILNGIVAGLIGNGNLVRGPLLLSFGLRKEIFIGTSAMVALILNIARSGAYAQGLPWTGEMVVLIVTMIPVMYVSVAIGKRLLVHISDRVFEILQAGIMVIGAVKFLFLS